MDGFRDWIRMVEYFAKTRLFPFISFHLSRARERVIGRMVVDWAGSGGDCRGFGGQVRGFGGTALEAWRWALVRGQDGSRFRRQGRCGGPIVNGRGEGSMLATRAVSVDCHPPEATYVHRDDNRKALGNFAQWVLPARRRPIVCWAVASVAADGGTEPSLDAVTDNYLHDNRINLITILHINLCTVAWLSFFAMDL